MSNKGRHDVTVNDGSAGKTAQWVREHGGKSVPALGAVGRNADFVFCRPDLDGDVRSIDSSDKGRSLKGAFSLAAC